MLAADPGRHRRARSTSWPSTASRAWSAAARPRAARCTRSCSAWQEAHARLGKHLELGERLCFGFHFYIADSREQGIREAAKYYEENMKMFGELRLVRALTDEQIEIMRDPEARPDRQAAAHRGRDRQPAAFLCGSPEQIVEHLKALEKRYPGLDRVSVSLSVGVPKAVCLEQLEWFATEVMPAFQGAKVREPAMA